MLIGLIVFIGLVFLIFAHEAGHFFTAKRFGIRVDEFGFGFPPKLFSFKKGETEYSFNLLPLGGFVKLAGDNLEEYKGKPDEYLSKAPGKRFWIIFFGPLLNYVLGILLFWMIFFIGYPTLTTKIGSLIDNFGAKEAGLQAGDKILIIDGQKTENWDDLQKIIYAKKQAESVNVSFLREEHSQRDLR